MCVEEKEDCAYKCTYADMFVCVHARVCCWGEVEGKGSLVESVGWEEYLPPSNLHDIQHDSSHIHGVTNVNLHTHTHTHTRIICTLALLITKLQMLGVGHQRFTVSPIQTPSKVYSMWSIIFCKCIIFVNSMHC